METEVTELGFEVERTWSVDDFQRFFHQINILYNRLYVLQEIKEKGRKKKLKYALSGSLSSVKNEDQLFVKSIEIHSPGDFNFLGLDKVIAQLRELLKDSLYRNRQERKKGEEDIRHQRAMNRLKEQGSIQELLTNQIVLMRQLGYEQEEIEIGVKALGAPIEQLVLIAEERRVSIKLPKDESQRERS